MKSASINVRVEPETARGLTWAINKYNFEHVDTLNKTDVIELLVKALLHDTDILMMCQHIISGLTLEEAAATAKGHNFKPITFKAIDNSIEDSLVKELTGRILEAVGRQHLVEVNERLDGLNVYYAIYIDSHRYTIYEDYINIDGIDACINRLVSLYKEDIEHMKEGNTHANTSTINQDSQLT